jgi:CO dehydrogenase maturation factor
VSEGLAAVRVAFVGKGGAGKSVIAGALARVLGRAGERVLAVDSDPLPGLSLSLGLGVMDAQIPGEAVEERPDGETGPRYRLRAGLSADDAVSRYALTAPDGVRFLQFGKSRGQQGGLLRSQFAFRQILDELPLRSWSIIGDLPGGTRQPFLGWARYAGTVVVVVEPTGSGLLSARRLARLAHAESAPRRVVAVANKVRGEADVELIRARSGLDVLAAVPWDETVHEADQRGRSVLDDAPGSPTVTVVASLAERLVHNGLGAARPG